MSIAKTLIREEIGRYRNGVIGSNRIIKNRKECIGDKAYPQPGLKETIKSEEDRIIVFNKYIKELEADLKKL